MMFKRKETKQQGISTWSNVFCNAIVPACLELFALNARSLPSEHVVARRVNASDPPWGRWSQVTSLFVSKRFSAG